MEQEKHNQYSIDALIRQTITYVNYQAEFYTKQKEASNKQNAFSFLKKVYISSDSEFDLFNLKLSITFSIPFITCQDVFISCLEGKKTTEIDSFSILIDPKALYELSEAMPCSITFSLYDNSDKLISQFVKPIRVLPIQESASEERIPEILSSFVTPNDEEVKRVVASATSILQNKYSQMSFGGYQYNDPNLVLEQIDAIYLALQKEGIAYSNPPSSFEKTFQRVRIPREVLSEKRGTCLDLAILTCSVLESVGLKPILILLDSHVLAGCFLNDDTLATSLEDNASSILKLASKGYDKMCLIETTIFTTGHASNFNQARELGYSNLSSLGFSCALDISLCREDYLLPIPTPKHIDGKTEIKYEPSANIKYTLSRVDTSEQGILGPNGQGSKDKFEYWEEKLLDLNLRNRLINMRIGKNSIQVMDTDCEEMVKSLYIDSKFNIQPFDIADPLNIPKNGIISFPKTSYNDKFISSLKARQLMATSINLRDTESNIKSLARKAKMVLEESGSNSLFLTVGLIKWYPFDKSAEAKVGEMYSPIILVPVKIPSRKQSNFFSLEADEDSITINTTALEYFTRFFDLDFSPLKRALPLKEDGTINIRLIYNTIRDIISAKKSWELIDDVSCIATFSFAHFVMWSDIRNKKEELNKNKIISSLVEGKKTYQEEEETDISTLDSKVSPLSLAMPLAADSSQIKAVYDSTLDRSFVLDGPPGTGKSQTIANMIVNFLYSGKKVLFVAEKEVALQVVKDRLDKLGLGDFCLQIHSNKAVKSSVLDSIEKALENGHIKAQTDYKTSSDEILNEQNELNKLLASLHENKGFFVSIYQAINLYLENKEYKDLVKFDNDFAKNMTSENYSLIIKSLEATSFLSSEVKGYKNNPLLPFQSRTYDIQTRETLFSKVNNLISNLSKLDETSKDIFSSYFAGVKTSNQNLSSFFCLLLVLKSSDSVIYDNLDNKLTELNSSGINLSLYQIRERLSIKNKFKKITINEDSILKLDGKSLYKKWDDSESFSWLKKAFTRHSILRKVRKCSTDHKLIDKTNIKEILNNLIRLSSLLTCMDISSPYIKKYISSLDLSNEKMASHYEKAFINTKAVIELSKRFDLDTDKDNTYILKVVSSVFKEGSNELYSKKISDFMEQYLKVKEEANSLYNKYSFNLFMYKDQDGYLSFINNKLKKSLDAKESLSIWVNLLNQLDYLTVKGLKELVDNYKLGAVEGKDLEKTFNCNLFYLIAVLGLKEENLTGLDSASIDKKINEYKTNIDKFSELTVKQTASMVTSNYPNLNIKYGSSSPFYLLEKLIKNHGRGNSLRKIFSDYNDLILTICPCLLMSPLSVAQYLELNSKPYFDMVIFDEASQIPTSEAIGAIARGKNVVIAGDQQQMPPTSFFSSNINNEDDEDAFKYEDMESLLDDAIAINIPRESLMWHYRSHHESLIAFSNNKFYSNKLLTFPSPSNQVSRVKYVYVNGDYGRGRGINKKEASAVKEEVLRRLKDPFLNKKSIGIITFNIKQQNLIEDMLSEAFSNNPELSFTPGGEEIFVKNLENVQGDERDVILFSTTYGKDEKTGTISLNFGPLSREKGERRLNVAVSRSRDEMLVFSSLKPEDISYQRAKNNGALFLYSFLVYAKFGVKTLSIDNQLKKDVRNDLAEIIGKELVKAGYDIDLNVGASSFKVDIAIKSQKDKTNYALGIIIDGPTYFTTSTSRDRNIVQPSILNRLSWNLIRIWSAEYFDKPNLVMEKIKKAYVTKEGEDNLVPVKEEVKESEDNSILQASKTIQFEKEEEEFVYPNNKEYSDLLFNLNRKVDFNMLPANVVAQFVFKVVSTEAPISKNYLNKRIRDSFSVSKIGSKMARVIDYAINISKVYVSYSSSTPFFWISQAQEKGYSVYRANKNSRPISEISFEEISNAMKDILTYQKSLAEDDLINCTIKLFALTSVKANNREYLQKACSFGLANNKFSSKLEKGQKILFIY